MGAMDGPREVKVDVVRREDCQAMGGWPWLQGIGPSSFALSMGFISETMLSGRWNRHKFEWRVSARQARPATATVQKAVGCSRVGRANAPDRSSPESLRGSHGRDQRLAAALPIKSGVLTRVESRSISSPNSFLYGQFPCVQKTRKHQNERDSLISRGGSTTWSIRLVVVRCPMRLTGRLFEIPTGMSSVSHSCHVRPSRKIAKSKTSTVAGVSTATELDIRSLTSPGAQLNQDHEPRFLSLANTCQTCSWNCDEAILSL